MDTKDFRTKTLFIPRGNGRKKGTWEIAIDIGYSAVKIFSPNVIACFPSYATKLKDGISFLSAAPEHSIIYKNNETGAMWLVGEVAEDMISPRDTSANDAAYLYTRDRYASEMFHVLADTGIGIACMSNRFPFISTDELVVQTGLPERYLDGDSESIKDVFEGSHSFSLWVGNGNEQVFNLTIERNNVFVMSQPKGTLFSICAVDDKTFHKDAKKYLSSSIMVFDGGFGTLDIFPIRNGMVSNGETYADLGMRRILEETGRVINAKYNVNVPVPAMQQYLETGFVKYVDRKNFTSKDFPFNDILEDSVVRICDEALQRINNTLDLSEYKYIVVTGGTGDVWLPYIRDKFKNLSGLEILSGNQNDELPCIFSNVRGYYYYRFMNIK